MWIDTVFFGMGCASGVGPERSPENVRARRLRSVSAAFCEATERGSAVADPPREPMGFHIPRDEETR